jgi:probable F420-dependent oxidoreductase
VQQPPAGQPRLGFTAPVFPFDVRETCEIARAAEDLGYTDAWVAEVGGTDGFAVASALGVTTSKLRIGIAIVPAYSRPPALIAMGAAAAQQASGGRFCLGIGASSPAIVEGWMGLAYERPFVRVKETVEVVRSALNGDKVDYSGETLHVKGFRLEAPPEHRVPIFLAALGPRMLSLAAERADGVALFLASEEGVRIAAKAAPGREVLARIMCFVDQPRDEVREFARWLINPYLAVPGYNRFVAEQGFEDVARAVGEAWRNRDRKAGLAAIPDELIDALVINGSPGECAERIASFRDAGLDTPVMMFLHTKLSRDAIKKSLTDLATA